MKSYEILCCGTNYYVKADTWSVGNEGLKFIIKNEIVAWFTTFDYWIYKGICDET